MRYGHFDDRNREYVIERPDTPLPWINYLGSEDFFGLISNTAGGYSFYKDPRLRRITRYRYNNAPLDTSGRYIYLRDDGASADPERAAFWSPTWQPIRSELDEYECRHGLGYTVIRSLTGGIEASIRYFVPLGENLELWELTLTNHRDESAQLSLIAAVEFNLWDALDDATNYQRNLSIGEVEVDDGVIYHKTEYRERRNHFSFMACSDPIVAFDTQRESFLGGYRGWDSPLGVSKGRLSNSIAHGWQPIGAQQVEATLEAGEHKTVIFILGYHENPNESKFDPPGSQTINKQTVLPIIERFRQPEQVETAMKSLRNHWTELLEKYQISTPDEHTDRMVNIWNAYQMMTTFNLSRSASYFESGIGRGIGFRDSNQDLLGFMHLEPDRARERILDLAATQLATGGAYHQYQPLTKRGNQDVGGNFNDDPLWLVLSVAAYIKETGDWDILNAPVPYENRPGTEESLLSHLDRSIQYTLGRLGPHNLPLIGHADWNDCLNLNAFSEAPGQSFQALASKDGQVAESIFIAGLFVLATKEMQTLSDRLGNAEMAEEYQQAAVAMESAIWESGWDGDWFLRAYDAFGERLGSNGNKEGQIFIEPQGICVMAGLGLEDGRAQQALDSVAKHLSTEHGIVLLQPPFRSYQVRLGEISSYPPGYKENGSVFCHSNPWIMIAEAMVGRGGKAHDYYLRINPSVRESISDVHRCEPYVYAQMIAGKDAPTRGEAKNSWLTGTAAWNYVAITQWILGIRPTYDGLSINPVVPPDWERFEATRTFRGTQYVIRAERRGPGNEVELEVNGKHLDGSTIPHSNGRDSVVHVTAWLGQEPPTS